MSPEPIDPAPLQAIEIHPCATHGNGPYVCHCRLATDRVVRELAKAMVRELLNQMGEIPVPSLPTTPMPKPELRPLTPDDDPAVMDDSDVPALSKEAQEGMVRDALARRAGRESVSVLRKPNVTEEG